MAENGKDVAQRSGGRTVVIVGLAVAVLAFFYFVMPGLWERFVTWWIEGRG